MPKRSKMFEKNDYLTKIGSYIVAAAIGITTACSPMVSYAKGRVSPTGNTPAKAAKPAAAQTLNPESFYKSGGQKPELKGCDNEQVEVVANKAFNDFAKKYFNIKNDFNKIQLEGCSKIGGFPVYPDTMKVRFLKDGKYVDGTNVREVKGDAYNLFFPNAAWVQQLVQPANPAAQTAAQPAPQLEDMVEISKSTEAIVDIKTGNRNFLSRYDVKINSPISGKIQLIGGNVSDSTGKVLAEYKLGDKHFIILNQSGKIVAVYGNLTPAAEKKEDLKEAAKRVRISEVKSGVIASHVEKAIYDSAADKIEFVTDNSLDGRFEVEESPNNDNKEYKYVRLNLDSLISLTKAVSQDSTSAPLAGTKHAKYSAENIRNNQKDAPIGAKVTVDDSTARVFYDSQTGAIDKLLAVKYVPSKADPKAKKQNLKGDGVYEMFFKQGDKKDAKVYKLTLNVDQRIVKSHNLVEIQNVDGKFVLAEETERVRCDLSDIVGKCKLEVSKTGISTPYFIVYHVEKKKQNSAPAPVAPQPGASAPLAPQQPAQPGQIYTDVPPAADDVPDVPNKITPPAHKDLVPSIADPNKKADLNTQVPPPQSKEDSSCWHWDSWCPYVTIGAAIAAGVGAYFIYDHYTSGNDNASAGNGNSGGSQQPLPIPTITGPHEGKK